MSNISSAPSHFDARAVCVLGGETTTESGAIRWSIAESGATPIAAGATAAVAVSCPRDTLALGGGFAASDQMSVTESYPILGGWEMRAHNNGADGTIAAYAVCAY
jgi:hypothetical protein